MASRDEDLETGAPLLAEYRTVRAPSIERRSTQSRFSTKQIAIAFITVALIGTAIGLIVWLSDDGSSDDDHHNPDDTNGLTFEQLFDPKWSPEGFTSRWASDTTFTTMEADEDGHTSIYLWDATTDAAPIKLFDEGDYDMVIDDYDTSPDGKKLLLATSTEKVFRHSFRAKYFIYDTEAKTDPVPLTLNPDDMLQCPSFSPEAGTAKVAFVRDNNVYIVDVSSDTRPETAVTTTGTASGDMVHGVPDWVYEEEILEGACALWWSSTGKNLAYLSFDDTLVEMYDIPTYQPDPSEPYPSTLSLHYPKPGTANPDVKVSVFDGTQSISVDLDLDTFGASRVIGRIYWMNRQAGTDTLWIRTMNRIQNQATLMFTDIPQGQPTTQASLVYEQSGNGAWLEWSSSVFILDLVDGNGGAGQDGLADHLIDLEIAAQDDANHIVLYRTAGDANDKVKFVTSGKDWEVLSIYGYDYGSQRVYFSTTHAGRGLRGALDTNICYVTLSLDAGEAGDVHCMTSGGYFSGDFSPDFKHVILYMSGTDFAPQYHLLGQKDTNPAWTPAADRSAVEYDSESWALVRVLVDNKALTEFAAQFSWPKKTFHDNIQSAQDGTLLNGYVIEPVNKKSDSPLLMYVYGGPGSQTVMGSWDKSSIRDRWHFFLAEQGYYVASVDGRGTGHRGQAFKTGTYKNLGVIETADQFAAGAYLARTLPVDDDRVAIWGWSYGGFMASTVMGTIGMRNRSGMTKAQLAHLAPADQFEFKLGLAVAPVSDWRYYDTMYTERYMEQPVADENLSGYNATSVLTKIQQGNFPHHRYLLCHGTADDNVHYQHAARIAAELVKKQVPFEMFAFTNQDHSINRDGSTQYIYRLLFDYLEANL